jgi:His/Glu/Gln/Arg/opine family amino acid ABC transporter permease subunit
VANFDWQLLAQSLPVMATGALATIEISLLAILIGAVLGIVFGLLQVGGPAAARGLVRAYVGFVRGVPLLVMIFLVYFGLPGLGVTLSAFASGAIALGLNSAAFMAEIVRASLQSIDRGQTEAARSIGLSEAQTALYVLLPQSLKRMAPPTTNEFIQLVKSSSLLSVIGVYELTRSGQTIIARTFAAFEIYLGIAVFYLVVIGVLSTVSTYLERNVLSEA